MGEEGRSKTCYKRNTRGSKIRGVCMTRPKIVFVYRLVDSVTMDMIDTHLVSNGIRGGGEISEDIIMYLWNYCILISF